MEFIGNVMVEVNLLLVNAAAAKRQACWHPQQCDDLLPIQYTSPSLVKALWSSLRHPSGKQRGGSNTNHSNWPVLVQRDHNYNARHQCRGGDS
ncbi:hypothetical protein CISIN_1g045132mg [Citrus sinensis]|uniref:Uncharacterized protein n=1 Tax=Citrus sinensis TaxID=2711 RepID=A0A067D0V9_CITSI|nr:hypothetical protein CISIN_1g045132mg [Citrus sinensis]